MKEQFLRDVNGLFNYMINNGEDIAKTGLKLSDLDYTHGVVQALLGKMEVGEQIDSASTDALIETLNEILNIVKDAEETNSASKYFAKNLEQILEFYDCRITKRYNRIG